jgi:signal transduction histidine kinase
MSYGSRGSRRALLAYVLLSVLIVGGVTWGTIATLRLEQEKAGRDVVDAALEAINRRLLPVIGREVSRPYYEYNACRVPEHVYSADPDFDPESLIQPSPLYTEDEDLTPWIMLHFQVAPNNEWQSPQLPEDCFWLSAFPAPDENLLQRRRELLHDLRETCMSYRALGAKVNQARQRDLLYQCVPGEYSRDGMALAEVGKKKGVRPSQSLKECLERGGSWAEVQSQLVPGEDCESTTIVQRNLGNSGVEEFVERPVGVSMSEMTAVWLDCDVHPQHQLAFVRSVDVEGVQSYQGFLVDWDMLKSELLDEISVFLPNADLRPVTDVVATARNRPVVLPNVELVADADAVADVPWTTTHLALIVAWAATLLILVAVGIGFRNVLALTERRTQFAYAVTHELRTPLTTLRLYTDMLASGLVKKQDQESYFKTLNSEAERLADMVNGVLEYARVENRSVALNLTSLTVKELLESIYEHCAGRCENAGKKLMVDVNGVGGSKVTTDPQLVRQVIANLVDNACKYSRDAADPSITVRAVRQHGDRLALDVEDHGPGVTPTDRSSIFKPFRRGKSPVGRSSGGIGLGLALARSWSRLLHGQLELVADRDHGDGGCFRLTIPRRAR